MGTDRNFESCLVEYGDKRVRGVSILCRCGHVGKVVMNSTSGPQCGDDTKESKIAIRKFEKLGWLVGDKPQHDRCPNCVTSGKPAKQVEVKVAHNPDAAAPVDIPKMGREDRRIIFEKLNEVYDTDHYGPGFTDKKVAEGLGCPRSWVRQVRDEMFGPEGSNAEIDETTIEARALITKGLTLLENVSNLKATLETQKGQIERQLITINNLQRETAPITTAVSRMQDLLKSIDKAVR